MVSHNNPILLGLEAVDTIKILNLNVITVHFLYHDVVFTLRGTERRRSITCPWVWGMGCLMLVRNLTNILCSPLPCYIRAMPKRDISIVYNKSYGHDIIINPPDNKVHGANMLASLLALCEGNSRGAVMQKVFPFHDVIMAKLVFVRLETEEFSKDLLFCRADCWKTHEPDFTGPKSDGLSAFGRVSCYWLFTNYKHKYVYTNKIFYTRNTSTCGEWFWD